MNKEKEIEDMAKELHCATNESFISCRKIARILVERRGYGNVKQAVKEFAENIIELLDEMGMERSSEYNDGYDDGVADCITNIKSRLTELYGADE